jgi:hypothetical protein
MLPASYFHVVFTLPLAIGDIAYQNKAVIYDLLFKASSETTTSTLQRTNSVATASGHAAAPPGSEMKARKSKR